MLFWHPLHVTIVTRYMSCMLCSPQYACDWPSSLQGLWDVHATINLCLQFCCLVAIIRAWTLTLLLLDKSAHILQERGRKWVGNYALYCSFNVTLWSIVRCIVTGYMSCMPCSAAAVHDHPTSKGCEMCMQPQICVHKFCCLVALQNTHKGWLCIESYTECCMHWEWSTRFYFHFLQGS